MKRALVTGGSGAIGAALCRRLARDGLHVTVHGNANPGRAEEVAAAIRADGGQADALSFDLTDAEACAAAARHLLAAGPVQVLVHNAGIHDDAPMAGMSAGQWHKVVDVSLTGFYNITQPLLLPMIRTRWGRILAITSISGVTGNRGQVNYAAAKAGLHGATKALALECADRGITVNAIAPGVIATPDTDALFPAERLKAMVPMKRAGKPEEVADLAAFLASEQAAYITGQIIGINGGMA